jgi:hypothetical protein
VGQSASPNATRCSTPARCAGHPGGVSERGEQAPGYAQARFLSASFEDLASYGVFEAGHAEASGALELAAVTLEDHVHCYGPDARAEGLLRASNAVGQILSSSARICWTWLTISMISCSRRAPRCRSRPQVSSTGSGR